VEEAGVEEAGVGAVAGVGEVVVVEVLVGEELKVPLGEVGVRAEQQFGLGRWCWWGRK
jgi:hypothetical protein